jgi:arachidonate 5-lipoxygenase
MNASRYQLPQHVSDDRRRARAAVLEQERRRFALKRDAPQDEGFHRLPPDCAKLPSDADFPASKLYGELAAYRLWTSLNLLPGTAKWMALFQSPSRYLAIFQGILGPREAVSRWREDGEFGRQRLTGVNPMQVRLLREDRKTALWKAAKEVLAAHRPAHRIEDLFAAERLFYTDYGVLWHPRIQGQVVKGATLAAPTCLFWQNDTGHLMPLAIQLKPAGEPKNPVFTPLSPEYDWLMARAHAQAADTHTHEGTYHLLETHLVSGIVALCMYRQLHPDHPIRQLLEPHYEQNLAINKLAMGGLLAKGGTIDTALAGRVNGTLDAARAFYAGWSFERRSLEADLEERGVGRDRGNKLPFYYYREDALEVYAAVKKYVSSILALYYENDKVVADDYELQRWVAEVAQPDAGDGSAVGGDVPGFPDRIATREQLYALVADLVFRAGPQHAAVNNGQFDAYGWIPNAPALIRAKLPEEPSPEGGHFDERRFWKALPSWSPSTSQVNMVWVLSAPTRRTLLHAGESPAFHPSICPEAEQIVGGFRRRLQTISQSIQRRNQTLDIPYRFLDPMNISRSTDI